MAIRKEAQKLADRHNSYHNNLHFSHERDEKRLGKTIKKVIQTPEVWKIDCKFNPYYVLKHSNAIARSIALKLKSKTYVPFRPFIKSVQKAGGGTRSVQVYQIPDAAVSNFFYNHLLKKNKHRFSSFSYAYRRDRNVHFAIQDISVDLAYHSRLFIAEFDFSDFFGSIDHTHLLSQLNENGFLVSETEKSVINGFIEYATSGRGIPQGTSISLFLANLACWSLDKEFEMIGLKFARYADDTLVWSSDYQKIGAAYSAIQRFSKLTGVAINFRKSDGISLLTNEKQRSEFVQHKHYINFLGYKLYIDRTSIKDSNVRKIKKQISYLLFKNLIQPLRRDRLFSISIPANNRDDALLVAISQVRRYLYGNLSEQSLSKLLRRDVHRISFKGIMSFYPLVNDETQLKELDCWLCRTIYRTVRLRDKLLQNWEYNCSHQFPFNVDKKLLTETYRAERIGPNRKRLLTIPSFLRIYKALKIHLVSGGIEAAMNPRSDSYNYD